MRITVDVDFSAPRWWVRLRAKRRDRRCLRAGGHFWEKGPDWTFMFGRHEVCSQCGATRPVPGNVTFEWPEREDAT